MTVTPDAEGSMKVAMSKSAARLLGSAEMSARIPDDEIDWSVPIRDGDYGMIPESSTLYGTYLWDRLTEDQRALLTRHEMASIMQTGIWFEMILQEMVLRDHYRSDYHDADFQWAIKEIEEECRHTLMFARASQQLAGRTYHPDRATVELGRVLKNVAWGETAYGGILVAEEILDVLQRANRDDPRIASVVQQTSDIHVVEEARHMKYAREKMRQHMVGASKFKKNRSSLIIAMAAVYIVKSLVSPEVYTVVGLDPDEAVRVARRNENYQTFIRASTSSLMRFLIGVGLAEPISHRLYEKAHMM